MANITSTQVTNAADQLAREGITVSINAIREKLGTGSKTTILKHLQAWRSGTSKPTPIAVAISQALSNALTNELTSFAAASRAAVENKLAETEADVAALMQGGELIEHERDELTRLLQEMTTDRDTISGRATQQEVDMTLLSQRFEREQSALSEVQVQLAMEKLKLVDLQKRDVDQLAEIQRQADSLQAEAKARIAAEQMVAVLATKLDHALALSAKADAANAALYKELADASTELQGARGQIQTLQTEHSALIHKFQAAQLAAQEAVSTAKQADRTAAELRGRLDALLERSNESLARESASAAKQADRITASEHRDRQDPLEERFLEGQTLA